MAEDLFGKKELTRADKIKKSRKATGDLTRWVIDYLNNTGAFVVHRSNNTPSLRTEVIDKVITGYFDKDGNPAIIISKEVKHSFKANNIKATILDISGFRNDGIHIELEVKTGKDKLSPGQIERIKQITEAGGISFAFSDKETFLLQIKTFLPKKELAF